VLRSHHLPARQHLPAMCASLAVGQQLYRPRLRVARTRHMAALRATVIERALWAGWLARAGTRSGALVGGDQLASAEHVSADA
jgi:hypothetical protein